MIIITPLLLLGCSNLAIVCFDSFATKEEATTALNILKSDNKSAWILSL